MLLSEVDGNIEWTRAKRRIYNGDKIIVVDVGNGWICCPAYEPEMVINWSSFDAKEAQEWLKSVAIRHPESDYV